MIADVFYLFLWDNIKLHTVSVSITGSGVLVFSLWALIFQKFITWLLEPTWRLWSLLYLSSAWGTDPLCSLWNWALTSLALVRVGEQDAVGLMGISQLERENGPHWFILEELIIWGRGGHVHMENFIQWISHPSQGWVSQFFVRLLTADG